MTSIISTAVLRAAVLSAFDRGRYQVQFGTAPAGDDIAVVPASIVLDLAERDDDLLGEKPCSACGGVGYVGRVPGKPNTVMGCSACMGMGTEQSASDPTSPDCAEPFELFTDAEVRELRREVAAYQPESIVAGMFGADDHGPAVPAQTGTLTREPIEGETENGWRTFTAGPMVYEFTLQDAVAYNGFRPVELDAATQNHAPDYVAASNADWVHVYDRVTRERRTLKRPGEDKIVKGLAEVASGLRGRPVAMAARAQGKSAALSDAVEAALGDDLSMRRAAVEAGYASLDDYVEAPVPPPAPGPLTSAEGLMRGDLIKGAGGLGLVVEIYQDKSLHYRTASGEEFPTGSDEVLTFVGRPDADGWMDWAGGENPVGDAMVEVVHPRGGSGTDSATALRWAWVFNGLDGGDIVRFRLVDMPSLPSDT